MEHPTFLTKLLLTWIPIGQQPQADGLFFFYNSYQLPIDRSSSNQLLLVLFNAQATNRG